MADAADMAQASTEVYAKAAQQRTSQQSSRESSEFCENCGERILEARRKAVSGCRFCITCQEEADVG